MLINICSISGWIHTKPDPAAEALSHRTNTQAINISVQASSLSCVGVRLPRHVTGSEQKNLSRAQFPVLDTSVAKVVTRSVTAGGTAAGPFENESERRFGCSIIFGVNTA